MQSRHAIALPEGDYERGWKVQEGTAAEVAPALRKDLSEVLAFVVQGEDRQTVRMKFKVLKQVAGMLHVLVDERSAKKWDALVEALTPDVQLSTTKIAEAGMLSAARAAVLESNDFITASSIAEAANYSIKNPSSQPNRWKRNGQIFAITHKGADYYPRYALNPQDAYRPFPIIADILRIFAGKKDGWGDAFWFGSLNSYLKNRKPKDLFLSDPESVLKAAELETIGIQHG
jgi:hypothetical protein